MTLLSCNSAKQVQPQVQNGYQGELLDPNTMKSNVSQCERLARQGWTVGKVRGYGSGESGNRDMARQRAALSAKNEIASTMSTLVQSYFREYNEDTSKDGVTINSQDFQGIQEQIIKEKLVGAKIIFSDVKRHGNLYFYEVCVELDKTALEEELLKQSEKKGIRMDSDKFRESAQAAWDKIASEQEF